MLSVIVSGNRFAASSGNAVAGAAGTVERVRPALGFRVDKPSVLFPDEARLLRGFVVCANLPGAIDLR